MIEKKGDYDYPEWNSNQKMLLFNILHSLSCQINVFMEIHHSLIGSCQVMYGSCFQGFASYEMDLPSVEKILAFLAVVIDLSCSNPSMIFHDWLLSWDKYWTFPFSHLSLRVSLTLRERKNMANQLCYQTLKGQRCTGYLRESVKAISSLISHLVANNPRGIPNGLPPH